MGKVLFINFNPTPINLDEDFYIEILDSKSGDSYFYFEDDMIPEATETESFQALSKMINEWDSDYIKRY